MLRTEIAQRRSVSAKMLLSGARVNPDAHPWMTFGPQRPSARKTFSIQRLGT
jgi:hypothetical protein